MIDIFDIVETMIYELTITVSSQFIVKIPDTERPSSIAVSPASNETLTASGYFMKMKKSESTDKIMELRDSGNCPIPENFSNFYSIRHDDEDWDTPYTVENFVAANSFGTIVMDDEFSNWFNANTETTDKFVVIEKMELIDPTTKECVFTMDKF